MNDKTSFNAEEASFKHSIIQFSQVLLEKYVFPSPRNKLNEISIYGYLFGRLLKLDGQQLTKLLDFETESSDPLLNLIWVELLQIADNNNKHLSESFKLGIEHYLKSHYSGPIDNSRANSLIGDIFLLNLFESTLGLTGKSEKVLTEDMIKFFKEGKTQDFLGYFLKVIFDDSSDVNAESISKFPELIGYLRVIIATLQYREYAEFEMSPPKEGQVSFEELKYLERHLSFMKIISTDIYDYIEREEFQFKPSDTVMRRYFYIASLLIKTEYDKSISLNKPSTADFFRLKLGDETSLRYLVNEKVSEEIDPRDRLRSSTIWILNPFKELKEFLGILGSWILWDMVLFLLIVLAPYYTHYVSSGTFNAIIFSVNFKPEYIPFFFEGWLFLSLLGLFLHLINIKRKTEA